MATSSADVALLMRRAGFGASASEIDALAQLSDRAAVVDVILGATPYVGPPAPVMTPDGGLDDWQRFVALSQWWIDRMARSTSPIIEKMTLFWHGLFTTSFAKVFDPPMIAAQHHYYRSAAMGNFRSLAHGMSMQPAMLDYLDNAWSTKWSPNQNYARELLELFLLGVGNYTEADVDASARAWTGHSIDGSSYLWRPQWHDEGSKTFMGHTGNLDGADIVDIIFDDPAKATVMARWIAGKLWAFFAHPNPPAGVVDAIAAALQSGWDITAALRVLFNRSEFYATASVQGHVRSPLEYIAAVLKGLLDRAHAADIHPEWWYPAMGQMPFNPPTVEGWKHNGYWVSTASSAAKADFVRYASFRLNELGRHPFAALPADAGAAVDLALATFNVTTPSAGTRAVLVDWLTQQRTIPYQGWFERHGMFVLVLLCPELQIG
ncbi:MAG: DUF1800 domain-containing protein [Acidimicrobiales bacterium]|nr:DUF1800 domain-containing protein [Acidimicrobiales bacterium]